MPAWWHNRIQRLCTMCLPDATPIVDCRALIFTLNGQNYPFEDERLLRDVLKLVFDFFDDKSTSNFFYMNDLHASRPFCRRPTTVPPVLVISVPRIRS